MSRWGCADRIDARDVEIAGLLLLVHGGGRRRQNDNQTGIVQIDGRARCATMPGRLRRLTARRAAQLLTRRSSETNVTKPRMESQRPTASCSPAGDEGR
jgi:hypothetical protein